MNSPNLKPVAAQVGDADPFDPAAYRLGQNFGADTGVRREFTEIDVRRPGKQEFFRVHPDEEFRMDTMLFELEEDREFFLVAPRMQGELQGEAKPYTIFTAINRDGEPFLVPVRITIDGEKENSWHSSRRAGCVRAMEEWVRLKPSQSARKYLLLVAQDDLPDAAWPDLTLRDLLRLGFGGRVIDGPDHIALKRLKGVK